MMSGGRVTIAIERGRRNVILLSRLLERPKSIAFGEKADFEHSNGPHYVTTRFPAGQKQATD